MKEEPTDAATPVQVRKEPASPTVHVKAELATPDQPDRKRKADEDTHTPAKRLLVVKQEVSANFPLSSMVFDSARTAGRPVMHF